MTFRIGVLGLGVMGSGIAQVLALAGHDIVGCDISADATAKARGIIEDGRYGLRSAVTLGRITDADADQALARLTLETDRGALADCDIVIEAVPEKLDLKVAVFRELDRLCQPKAILASNSSGFPIAALCAATDRPDRVVGWHWASPVPVMNLAEIVRGAQTSDETIETVIAVADGAGKNPIVVVDAPMSWGYVSNRVYGAMVREAYRVVFEKIATREEVDQLMKDCFRWPVGPFAMMHGADSGWTDN